MADTNPIHAVAECFLGSSYHCQPGSAAGDTCSQKFKIPDLKQPLGELYATLAMIRVFPETLG